MANCHPNCPGTGQAWVDLSFDLQGPLAAQAQHRFNQDWAFATQQAPPPVPQAEAMPPPAPDGAALAQLVASGPDQVDDTLYALLLSGCYTARRRILAVTPYFVPDDSLQMALTLAARRGLQVDLVLPRRSNHRLADVARNRALRELWAAGAHIWLAPHMVHAKAIVIDDTLALVGSANLDARSLFLNYELMVAFYHAPDIGQFRALGGNSTRRRPALCAAPTLAVASVQRRPGAVAGLSTLSTLGHDPAHPPPGPLLLPDGPVRRSGDTPAPTGHRRGSG